MGQPSRPRLCTEPQSPLLPVAPPHPFPSLCHLCRQETRGLTRVLEVELRVPAPSSGWGLLTFLICAEAAPQGSMQLPPHSLTLPLTQKAAALGPASMAPEYIGQQTPRVTPRTYKAKGSVYDLRPPVSGLRRP